MAVPDTQVFLDTVGSLLRARTQDTGGNQVGSFTTATRPTDTQVAEISLIALGDVEAAVGVAIPDALWGAAETVISYKTAMLVELSYFPEQVTAGRSPYEQIKTLYDEALKALVTRANDPSPESGAGVPSPPSYAFPLPTTLDYLLGPSPGGYGVPYSGGTFQ